LIIDPGLALVIASFAAPIVGALGYYFQAMLRRRAEVEREARQRVATIYADMYREIRFVFFPEVRDQLTSQERLEHGQRFFGRYGDIWLYSTSDDTIRELNNILSLYKAPPPQDQAGKIDAQFFLAARRELQAKTTLTVEDYRFLRVT